MMTNKPKVGIKLLYYLLPESLVTHARILFLVSLLFVALLDPFDPYSPFKFLIFINLVCLLFIGHKNYNNHSGTYTYTKLYRRLHNNGLFTSTC